MTDKHNISDILRYINAEVPSIGSGWRKMRCPYHSDGHASAAVNFDANRFKCHGCGVSGDTYDLIMKEKGGTLSEAIEFAQTISTSGDTVIRKPSKVGRKLSFNPSSVGRRGSSISSRRSG
jgi:hypothetical protein